MFLFCFFEIDMVWGIVYGGSYIVIGDWFDVYVINFFFVWVRVSIFLKKCRFLMRFRMLLLI